MFLTNALRLMFIQRGLILIDMFRENLIHNDFFWQRRIEQRFYQINHTCYIIYYSFITLSQQECAIPYFYRSFFRDG